MIKITKFFTPKQQTCRMDYEQMDKLVHIDGSGLSEQVCKKLFGAQDVMANYVNNKGLNVDIFDARKNMENVIEPIVETDRVMVRVTNNLTGDEFKQEIKPEPYEPFLRSVYKTLENLTKNIT